MFKKREGCLFNYISIYLSRLYFYNSQHGAVFFFFLVVETDNTLDFLMADYQFIGKAVGCTQGWLQQLSLCFLHQTFKVFILPVCVWDYKMNKINILLNFCTCFSRHSIDKCTFWDMHTHIYNIHGSDTSKINPTRGISYTLFVFREAEKTEFHPGIPSTHYCH